MKHNVCIGGIDLAHNLFGAVSNVDRDGSNAWQIKAIGVVISTFETLSNIHRCNTNPLGPRRQAAEGCHGDYQRRG